MTRLKTLIHPIPSPVDKLAKTIKKAQFLKAVLNNTDSNLTPSKVKQLAKDSGWGSRPQDAIKDEEVQLVLKPVTDQLIRLRIRIVEALEQKDFSNERTTDLIDSMDKLTKNIQLLTGGETEKHKVVFGWDSGQEQQDSILVQPDSPGLINVPELGNP